MPKRYSNRLRIRELEQQLYNAQEATRSVQLNLAAQRKDNEALKQGQSTMLELTGENIYPATVKVSLYTRKVDRYAEFTARFETSVKYESHNRVSLEQLDSIGPKNLSGLIADHFAKDLLYVIHKLQSEETNDRPNTSLRKLDIR